MPEVGSRASSGRAWQLWAARHSQEEAGPLGTQPMPRVLELAASKAAHFPAVDHSGTVRGRACRRGITYGCSLYHIRLQPLPHTVAASTSYGCSLYHIGRACRRGWHPNPNPSNPKPDPDPDH